MNRHATLALLTILTAAIAGCDLPPTEPDTTPPTIAITAPTSGSNVADSMVITLKVDDDAKVGAVFVMVNGDTVGALMKEPWQHTVKLNTYKDGDITITATAVDDSKNAAQAAPVKVTVKNPFKLTFSNPLSTDVVLTALEQTRTIAPGGAATFTFQGNPGKVPYTAETFGRTYITSGIVDTTKYTVGGALRRVGELVKIAAEVDASESAGLKGVEIEVPADYFFLYVRNSGATPLGPFTVGAMTDSVVIANDGALHGLGYYKAGANVKGMKAGGAGEVSKEVKLPGKVNQTAVVEFD